MLLLSERKYLDTSHGRGKRILNPDEHILTARKTVRRSAKLYRKAGHQLAATNCDMLNEEGRNRVLEEARKWSTLEHLHNELLRKPPKKVEEKYEMNQLIANLVGYLKQQ